MTHIKTTAASAAPQQHALPDYEEQQQAEDQHRRLREKSHFFSGVHQPTKRQCVFQSCESSPGSVQWFRPSSAWFTAAPLPKQTPKRGRDGVDDLCKSLKRLRTEDEEEAVPEEVPEEREAEEKDEEKSPCTALILSRPRTIRLELPRAPSPSYSLPPPVGTFPVVLYKGPPSPPLRLAYEDSDPPDIEEFPPDIEEFTPMLSKENRTLRVSPSFTIELVDDDEPEPRSSLLVDDYPQPARVSAFEDEDGPRVVELEDEDDETEAVTGQLRATVMSDDDDL